MAVTFSASTPVSQGIIESAPSQLAAGDAPTEWQDSQELELDFTRGIIVHILDLPGNPPEAMRNPLLGDFHPGAVHPWYGMPEVEKAFDQYFLTRQKFAHQVRSDDKAKRFTRVTSTFQKGPCPHLFTEEVRSSLRMVDEWYSDGEPPYMPLTKTFTPVAIPRARPVVVRHYPKIIASSEDLLERCSWVGRLNRRHFRGQQPGAWMFEGLQARMLYGTIHRGGRDYLEAAWEVSTFYEWDPYRNHEVWMPKAQYGLPEENPNETDRKNMHLRFSVYPLMPESGPDLIDLMDAFISDELCIGQVPPP